MKSHPLCGKCHSRGVYLDYDQEGNTFIVCPICGNRYPGSRERFYMSDKPESQTGKEREGIMEYTQEATKQVKLCSTCHIKPTISESSNICASCMAKKANEKMRLSKMAGNRAKPEKTKEDKRHTEKVAPRPSQAVTIDFSQYAHVLKQVVDLAEVEIRPLNLQIIYLLKRHFGEINKALKGD